MNELETIYELCKDAFGVDPAKKNRTSQLRFKLSNLRTKIPHHIEELLFETDENEVERFINLKVIPQLKQYRHYRPKEEVSA
tara:strand:- start:1728 stop:1973 length:246 start_codon:yes stop_codon:yes gene_type:complete